MAKAKNKKKNMADMVMRSRNRQVKREPNPFDVHINREKQRVLGRQSKADRGLPGVARSRAISKRKRTLLQEYKNKDKDNIFIDRRIGEKGGEMSEAEKSLARFAAQRLKSQKKKQMYSLNDDEVLTHRGQTLEEIEKFEDPKSEDEWSDEENRDGRLDKKFVSEAHFGGGVLSKSDGTARSQKDVVQQLIADSKKHKAEMQKQREETIGLTEKLDTEWRDLIPLMTRSDKCVKDVVAEKTRADDYDIAVRQLKFESRGTPSDKLKSEEEVARETKETLEALERDRVLRMKGSFDDSTQTHKSADALDDDYLVEDIEDEALAYDENGLAKGLEEKSDGESSDEEKLDGESSDEEDSELEDQEDEEDDLSDLKVSESSSEDEVTEKDTNNSKNSAKVGPKGSKLIETREKAKVNGTEGSAEEKRTQNIRDDLQRRKEIMEKARQELPYTYKAPESLEELQQLLQDRNPDYQSVILERILKCNHWTLGQGNREKLCKVFDHLLQYSLDSAPVIGNDGGNDQDDESAFKYFKLLDRLCPHLYDFAQASIENAATCIQNYLRSKHEEFIQNKRKYPELGTLVLFKVVALLFPTSDFRHPIVTPCVIFMSEILTYCRIKGQRDIARGLFVCTLILEYHLMSKRFSPQAINFLRGVIFLATPKPATVLLKTIPPFKSIGDASNLLILNEGRRKLTIDPESPCMKVSDLFRTELDDEFKLRAFTTALGLAVEFKKLIERLDSAYVIFEPIIKLLKIHSFEKYPKNIEEYAKVVCKDLESLADKPLVHLVREKKKPKALKLYEPLIEKVYVGKKHRPMSKKKAEREKMIHKIKKEKKSAMREIRRDGVFLAKIKIKEQIKSDAERKRRVKEIYGDAAAQQGELNHTKRKK